MLEKLARLAARSEQLRESALEKRAIAGAVARGIGNWAMKNKMMAGMVGVSGVTGGMATVGRYKQDKAGFSPAAQSMMLGQPPIPPGA